MASSPLPPGTYCRSVHDHDEPLAVTQLVNASAMKISPAERRKQHGVARTEPAMDCTAPSWHRTRATRSDARPTREGVRRNPPPMVIRVGGASDGAREEEGDRLADASDSPGRSGIG